MELKEQRWRQEPLRPTGEGHQQQGSMVGRWAAPPWPGAPAAGATPADGSRDAWWRGGGQLPRVLGHRRMASAVLGLAGSWYIGRKAGSSLDRNGDAWRRGSLWGRWHTAAGKTSVVPSGGARRRGSGLVGEIDGSALFLPEERTRRVGNQRGASSYSDMGADRRRAAPVAGPQAGEEPFLQVARGEPFRREGRHKHSEETSQPSDALGEHVSEESTGDMGRGRGRGRGRGGRGRGRGYHNHNNNQYHNNNHPQHHHQNSNNQVNNRGGAHPVGTPPSSHAVKTEQHQTQSPPPAGANKPHPGPLMPDGTRGFSMGRGKPQAFTPSLST